jgi:hypothetical protein
MGLGTIISNIGDKAKNLLSVFSGLSSVKDRIKINTRVVLIVALALLVIIALLLVLAVVSHRKTVSNQTEAQYDSSDDTILRERLPVEDFFLPYEPDFVPDVLLEREPKDSWTEEDARPFWTDPLEGNEGIWRKRIESGINSLLENVP